MGNSQTSICQNKVIVKGYRNHQNHQTVQTRLKTKFRKKNTQERQSNTQSQAVSKYRTVKTDKKNKAKIVRIHIIIIYTAEYKK